MSKRIQTLSVRPSRVEMDTPGLPRICPGSAGPRSRLLCQETRQFPRRLQHPRGSPCFPSGPFLAFLWLSSDFQGDDSHGLCFPGSQENWLLHGISQWETLMSDLRMERGETRLFLTFPIYLRWQLKQQIYQLIFFLIYLPWI